MKKRRLRVFPVVCVVVVLAMAIWAMFLMVGCFDRMGDNGSEKEPAVNTDVQNKDDASDKTDVGEDVDGANEDEEHPEEIAPAPETPDEDKTVFVTDAPKPVYTQAQLLEMYPDAVLDSSDDAGQTYIDEIVFIGDSTTHGMAFYAVLEGGKDTEQVWTPKSGTLAMWNLLTEKIVYPQDDSEMLIADAVALEAPDKIVLTLGVNGVSSLSEKDFKKYYQDLIDVIKEKSPDTTIILQSIYPVCDYYQYVNSISMEKINTANSWIALLAHDNGIYYLNTISALVNEKGYLTESYCNGDGIHISKEGFNVILDYIRTHAVD